MRTKRDEKKKNEALVVVVEPSIDQKISNTGQKFNRVLSMDSILNIPMSKKNGRKRKKEQKKKGIEQYYSNQNDEQKRNYSFCF
jgi:hypothetical protein